MKSQQFILGMNGQYKQNPQTPQGLCDQPGIDPVTKYQQL